MTEWVLVGRVAGLYGLRGWVKIVSYTDPKENIAGYTPWYLKSVAPQQHLGETTWQALHAIETRVQGNRIVAHLGVDEPEAASRWIGADIAITRAQLPVLAAGDYYWSELIGLRVMTIAGVDLGCIDYLIATGANDVMVVKGERERLIPYIKGSVVREIDLHNGLMRVMWDSEL